jgi:hypothetical protein
MNSAIDHGCESIERAETDGEIVYEAFRELDEEELAFCGFWCVCLSSPAFYSRL